MKIERALKLKKDEVVWYPADSGNKAGLAVVKSVSPVIQHTKKDIPFVWVHLKEGGTWPSNRLV